MASRRPMARGITVSRAMGYVADVFDTETLAGLPGTRAIGHYL